MQTERDALIVDWVGRIGAAGAEHVMRRFGMGRSWAYTRLSRQVALGALEEHRVLYRQPGLYVATSDGLRGQGLSRLGVYRVSPGGFVHAREVAAAAAALHFALPGFELLAERELRLIEGDEGKLLASVKVGELAGGLPALHRPDLVAVAEGRTLAVEVELSVKAPRRLQRICTAYARARHVGHVYYLAEPAPARAVARAVAETRAESRITVLPLADTAALGRLEAGEGAARV